MPGQKPIHAKVWNHHVIFDALVLANGCRYIRLKTANLRYFRKYKTGLGKNYLPGSDGGYRIAGAIITYLTGNAAVCRIINANISHEIFSHIHMSITGIYGKRCFFVGSQRHIQKTHRPKTTAAYVEPCLLY